MGMIVARQRVVDAKRVEKDRTVVVRRDEIVLALRDEMGDSFLRERFELVDAFEFLAPWNFGDEADFPHSL